VGTTSLSGITSLAGNVVCMTQNLLIVGQNGNTDLSEDQGVSHQLFELVEELAVAVELEQVHELQELFGEFISRIHVSQLLLVVDGGILFSARNFHDIASADLSRTGWQHFVAAEGDFVLGILSILDAVEHVSHSGLQMDAQFNELVENRLELLQGFFDIQNEL